jgi:glycosyltransferase involved in cell wall biosynthesis
MRESVGMDLNTNDVFETLLFLPESIERKGEGGLRTKNIFKKSYEDKPLVSIITVVYNGEKYLEQTISSVLNQTYNNVEYIIIDGGSCDGTLDIVRRYEHAIDYWVSESDNGISDAFNKGIRLCSGDIIGIINADDWYEEDALKTVAEYYQANRDVDVLHGNMRYWFSSTEKMELIPDLKTIKYEMNLFHPSVFVTLSTYKDSGLFDIDYRYAMDYELLLRFFMHKKQFLYIDSILANMRGGGESNRFVVKSILEMRMAQMKLLNSRLLINWRISLLMARRLMSIVIKKCHLYFLIDIYRRYRR